MTQKEFRAKHMPERPPFIGVALREGDCHALVAGLVPDSIRQMVAEGLARVLP